MNGPLKTAEDAVRALGALPMPVGPEPQALSAERLAEAEDRGAHLYEFGGDATADEWNRLAGDDVPALVAEIRRLEAQRDRRRARLAALQNDALNMRGTLSPNGEASKVPMELGDTLTPAVEWLINRVAELDGLHKQAVQRGMKMCEKAREARARVAESEGQRAALVARLRSGQRWERDRNPALISQDFVSQDELRAIFGIKLTAPWDEPTGARHPICPECDDLDARYGPGASDEYVLQMGEARDADVADERGDVDESQGGGL